MDHADVHPDSKDYNFFVKEYNADVTASRLIEAWRNQAPVYPPPAFIADAQLADYLVIEQDGPTEAGASRAVSPVDSFASEGDLQSEREPRDYGGFADVWRRGYKDQDVALKVVRVRQDNRARLRKEVSYSSKYCAIPQDRRYKRKTMHGVRMDAQWELAPLSEKRCTKMEPNRLREIVEGLRYLHAARMVHGDLKGANVLINDEGSACLIDFGLTASVHNVDTIGAITTTSNSTGSTRWMAPELLDPEQYGLDEARLSYRRDVYALAMVMYETRPALNDVVETLSSFENKRSIILHLSDRDAGSPSLSTQAQNGSEVDELEETSTDVSSPAMLHRGTKRPAPADFVDMKPSPLRSHASTGYNSYDSLYYQPRLEQNSGTFVGLSSDEGDKNGGLPARDGLNLARTNSQAGSSTTRQFEFQAESASFTIALSGELSPEAVLEKEIERMRELIAERERNRLRKVV
ncbi:uncharacterized protein FIBRA_02475 [Fibroporia radiculosa]|uniref:Protein kinase domain-containing protein n=1 Tax=Fibroporia radiculosa TaxID=599839 RepID=J4G1Q1_9APHY|nr:uncharacterized protein FIBRA_02475 [Fibroporia radiculosa]CCM00443.1 predicted protein [Fibroporia radiculosa]